MHLSRRLLGLSILVALAFGVAARAEDLSRDYGKLFTDGLTSPRWIALTFDDGPGPATPEVLRLLKEAGAPATFFMEGSCVEKYPEFARQVLKEGHMIGNHSFTHPNFYFYKKADKEEKLASEIRSTQKAIKAATGIEPEFMRMPHGYVRPWVKEIAKREKLVLVNWTYGSDWVDKEKKKLPDGTHKWVPISQEDTLKGYLSRLRPGAILLFHDGGTDRSRTLWVLERVLQEIKKRTYSPSG